MQKEKKKNICLFLFVCLFCLIIFEIVSPFFITVCVTYKNCPKAEYVVNDIEFNMGVKLNSDGFRDSEFDSLRKDTVVLIGDSYVFGWGVEENQTIAHLIEEKAKRELNKKNNYVLNLGIEGSSMDTYLDSLKNYGKKSETIILIYNPISDIISLERKRSTLSYFVSACSKLNSCALARKAYFKLTNKNLGPSELANFLLKINLKKLNNIDQKYIDLALGGKMNPFILLAPLEEHYLINKYDEAIFNLFDTVPENKKELDEFITWAQKREKNVIVVLLPQNIAVSDAYIKGLQSIGFLDSDTELKSIVCNPELHLKIKSFLNDYNIEIIDLQEEMCKSNQAGKFYYNLDWHLTPLGNEFIANIIYNALINKEKQKESSLGQFHNNPYKLK